MAAKVFDATPIFYQSSRALIRPEYIYGDGVVVRKVCAVCRLLDPPDDHRHPEYEATKEQR